MTVPCSDAPDAPDIDGIPMDTAAAGAAGLFATDVCEATDVNAHVDDAHADDAHADDHDPDGEDPTDKDGDANGTALMPVNGTASMLLRRSKIIAEERALHDRISAETPRRYIQPYNRIVADATYNAVGYQSQMRELITHGRRPFTITTCVDSAATRLPHPFGVLNRRRNHSFPHWWPTLGSGRITTNLYRLLDDSSEPQVFNLDLNSVHMERRMHTLIASRGHIPLLYGGGHTAIEQIKDTDLHGLISMWPVERYGSGRGEEGEESSVASEEESDA